MKACYVLGTINIDQTLDFFRKAVQEVRDAGILHGNKQSEYNLFSTCCGLSPAHALYSEAINNMSSLCLVHVSRKGSIAVDGIVDTGGPYQLFH